MRISWHQYFMDIAKLAATRSTCIRRQVGAVAVINNRIISSGYNGVPSGISHCTDVGCLREQLNIPSGQQSEKCKGLHAEQNLIIQAATSGVSIQGATIYCNTYPCSLCAKMLINCGVKTIYYSSQYPDELAKELFKDANVELILI